jgi:signal transduction histidine kinase/CheY-like chemotaxis protein
MLTAVIAERNYILTGEEKDLAPYTQAKEDIGTAVGAIEASFADTPAQRQRMRELQSLFREKFAALDDMIASRRANGIGSQVRDILVERSMALLDRIDSIADDLGRAEKALLQQLEKRSASSAYSALAISMTGEFVALVLLSVAVALLQRQIARRKVAEADLLRAKDLAETANKAKSEFLANMSHEIRTPMNAILGFAELLGEQGTPPEKQKSYVDGIRAGGTNLLGIIDDILDLSKIEAGRLEIRPEPTRVRAIVQEVESIFSVAMARKSLAFRTEVAPEVPESLLLDAVRLRQVLFNLVGNAVKFTDSGSVAVSVAATTAANEGSCVDLDIRVRDTGIGIPAGQLDTIFQPFLQGIHEKRRFGGTGLGLTISRRLVEMMGGSLSVESEVGRGSTFRVSLREVRVASFHDEGQPTAAANAAATVEFENQRILLVKDVESNRRIVREYLRPFRVKLEEAEDGAQGVEMATSTPPDLILMDMQLPVMDGFEAVRRLKRSAETRRIPVIALTATATSAEAEEIRSLTDGYLRKPISRRELLQELSQFLEHHAPGREGAAPPPGAADRVALFLEGIEGDAAGRQRIVQAMRDEILPQYRRLRITLSVDEMRTWCARLREIGAVAAAPGLAQYADLMEICARAYQIGGMIEGLDAFEPVERTFAP